jgi:aminoglycoside phosphotransferase (APT) family kinase protein
VQDPAVAPDLERRLLDYLRAELEAPALRLAEALTSISGGYDTQIFSFRAAGGPAASRGPLILRMLASHTRPTRVLRERAVQEAVRALGYPAPAVLCASTDPSTLGAPFLVMERLAGRPMLDVKRFGAGTLLVAAQLRLHELDAAPVLRATEAVGAGDMITVDGLLADLAARVSGAPLAGLERAMDWLLSRRPAEPARRAICHGDFHPGNILMARGAEPRPPRGTRIRDVRAPAPGDAARLPFAVTPAPAITGVLDWPNAVVADPAYDVAATKVLLELTPVDVLDIRAVLRPVIDLARRLLLRRYLAGYRRRRSIDPAILAYYEAVACMRGLVRVAEVHRAAARSGAAVGRLDASSFGRRAAARFAQITGIAPSVVTASRVRV